MKTNETQRKTDLQHFAEFYFFSDRPSQTMKIKKNKCRSRKINENQWKPIKVNANYTKKQWESIEIYAKSIKTMQIIKKPVIINRNQWKLNEQP